MAHLPPFLARLGLGLDADTRLVRRAYARELKQIDQEADPRGFQELRQAYEAALGWAERRMAQAGPETVEPEQPGRIPPEAAPPPAAGPAQPSVPAPPDQTTQREREPAPPQPSRQEKEAGARPAPPEQRPPRPPTESPNMQAALVFTSLVEAMRHGGAGWNARSTLERCLADARLVNLESRDTFEWNVAALLADGWKLGHERLLDAAVEIFGWERDRRRLELLGGPGRAIDAAITERLTWRTQTIWIQEWHLRVLERVRQAGRPRSSELLRARPALQELTSHFPTWTHLIAPVETIAQWLKGAEAVPWWIRIVTRRPKLIRGAVRGPKHDQAYRRGRLGAVGSVAFVIAILRVISGGSHMQTPRTEPVPAEMAQEMAKLVETRRLEERCVANDGVACAQLGAKFTQGNGVAKDLSRAANYYQKGCDLGAANACIQVATIVGKGQGVTRDVPRALAVLQRACDLGDPAGCTRAGLMLQFGDGVPKDRARAANLLQTGCDRGVWLGCTGVAWSLEPPRSAAERQRAALLLQNACEKNEPYACHTLAIRAEYGTGVKRDLTRAASLYQTSCDLGLAFACGSVAKLLEQGAGIGRDPTRALSLHQKACDEGQNGASCASLARHYQSGDGVPKDLDQARRLYDKACTLGFKAACVEAKAAARHLARQE